MNQKIALVLSSGGARGLAHIGVIEQLEEMGFEITSISGSSIGSLIGGLYACGHLQDYKEWIMGLDKSNVFNLMDFQFKSKGFIKGERVFNHMEDWLDDYPIEKLPIPFTAVATDIQKRKEIVFHEGELSQAIRASVAVPGFLQPVAYEDGWLYDGGVVNPLPLRNVKRHEGDILVAVDLNAYVEDYQPHQEEEESVFIPPKIQEMIDWYNEKFGQDEKENKKPDLSYVSLMNNMFDMMQEEISRNLIKETPPDVLINIPREACSTFDFHKSEEMIQLGKDFARKAIEEQLQVIQ